MLLDPVPEPARERPNLAITDKSTEPVVVPRMPSRVVLEVTPRRGGDAHALGSGDDERTASLRSALRNAHRSEGRS